MDIYSTKRYLSFSGSDLSSDYAKITSLSISTFLFGASGEYNYTTQKSSGEIRLLFMIFGSNGYTERISSGDYGFGGQWGYKLDISPFFNSSNYYRPIIPIDNTRIVIPYKIYNL